MPRDRVRLAETAKYLTWAADRCRDKGAVAITIHSLYPDGTCAWSAAEWKGANRASTVSELAIEFQQNGLEAIYIKWSSGHKGPMIRFRRN